MTETQKHHIRQLQKAVDISRLDPEKLNPIERQRLRLDLEEFTTIVGFGTHYVQTESGISHVIPDRFIKEMVEGLRDTLAKFAGPKEFPLVINTRPKDVHFNVYLGDSTMPFYVHASMELGRDAAVYALLKHFERSGLGIDRVQVCPREDHTHALTGCAIAASSVPDMRRRWPTASDRQAKREKRGAGRASGEH
jgi:hypothetical protein